MHHFKGKKGILSPKNGFVFELMSYLAAFRLGLIPRNTYGCGKEPSSPEGENQEGNKIGRSTRPSVN
jgi:hypothetical protein